MKRDLDLCRRLLADIEGHGPDCAVTALRPGVAADNGLAADTEERVRYHVRLLIDAGLVKELDRSAGGVPVVRLTSAGHELLELAHSDARWREAKWVVAQRTGGVSLEVVTAVLKRWAVDATLYGARGRPRRTYRPSVGVADARADYLPSMEPVYSRPNSYTRVEPRYRFERDLEPTPVVTTRRAYPTYLERFDWRPSVDWRDPAERATYYRDGVYDAGGYRETFYADAEARDRYTRNGGVYRPWGPEVDDVSLPLDVV